MLAEEQKRERIARRIVVLGHFDFTALRVNQAHRPGV
jgi:hypothetical protein